MAMIQIKDLTFEYPGAEKPVFSHVDLALDTQWRLGLVGRNGRGKTTFLNLLRGKLEYRGTIISPEEFEYFPLAPQNAQQAALAVARGVIAPFDVWEQRMAALVALATPQAMDEYGEIEHAYSMADGYVIDEMITMETGKLGIHPEALQRPYDSLSGGEKVKLLLAALFLKKQRFLLIDEPTDHLDAEGRQTVGRWLAGKSGFILVSHDRAFLDSAVDHILAINRADIELQKGNYSSWHHNRTLQDSYEAAENRRLEKDITRLKAAAARTGQWSDRIEKSKFGGDVPDRGYVGHQAAKMMQRSKSIERRQTREIEEKKELLKNVEVAEPLKFHILQADKPKLVTVDAVGFCYDKRPLITGVSFDVQVGDRIAVQGANGTGKSTLLRLVEGVLQPQCGQVQRLSSLVVSSLQQETGALHGSLREYAKQRQIDESLFLTILRKLDFERERFTQDMHLYSEGQKKKVLVAASLAQPAHLFIWDEPLNYIDIYSREQIEKAVLACGPTMIFVEHDQAFVKNIATRHIVLK